MNLPHHWCAQRTKMILFSCALYVVEYFLGFLCSKYQCSDYLQVLKCEECILRRKQSYEETGIRREVVHTRLRKGPSDRNLVLVADVQDVPNTRETYRFVALRV